MDSETAFSNGSGRFHNLSFTTVFTTPKFKSRKHRKEASEEGSSMEKKNVQSQFESALEAAKLKIFKYDPSKSRSVTVSTGGTYSVERFAKALFDKLGVGVVDFPDVYKSSQDMSDFEELVREHAKRKNVLEAGKERTQPVIPDSYRNLVLNLDESHQGRETRFFMTTTDEYLSHVSGNVYLKVCNIAEEDAIVQSRKVVPQYQPRSGPGVVPMKNFDGQEMNVFNSYVPPAWMAYEGELPDRLPKLFEKLVFHLFPTAIEREYFFAWLHASLFSRAFVYLILCGPGAIGKNRLKLVMRALHGHHNSVDGKRSTLRDRFNSQLADSTLAWFDELTYDLEMENVMKEIQNDSISIERKGVDATRSTKIFASSVISNNKPRDNYIAFDARKFVPLQVSRIRLDSVMTNDEITRLSEKVESWDSPKFDIKFLAQIGRWVKKHGKSRKWPQLEYKGPMFYKLAHTSMSRWQKKAASMMIDGTGLNNSRIIEDPKKGFLWSTVAEQTMKKNGDRSLQFPDFSTVKHFFDVFVDGVGTPTFKTSVVPGNIMGDFYVKLINKNARILTEAEVNEVVTGDEDGEVEEEVYDL
jgi:hypothetical protein